MAFPVSNVYSFPLYRERQRAQACYQQKLDLWLQRDKKQHYRNIYAAVTKGSLFAFCLPFMFSPQIVKKSGQWLERMKGQPKPLLQAILKLTSDKKRLNDFYLRAVSLMSLGVLSQLQISINTRQPSKLLSDLLGFVYAIAGVIWPNAWFRPLGPLVFALWQSGERNDYENGRHFGKRREWDVRKFKSSRNILEGLRFVRDDLRYTFSLRPWRLLFQGHNIWQARGEQVSLAAQFSALVAATTFMKTGKLKTSTTMVFSMLAALFTQIATFSRGWQNKQDLDGKLQYLGTPFPVIGRTFIFLKEKNYLSSISVLGDLSIEGKRRNSVSQRNALEYLAMLADISRENPAFQAGDVLQDLKAYPQTTRKMLHLLGHTRFDFVLSHLQQAQASGLPLWQYLQPVLRPANTDN